MITGKYLITAGIAAVVLALTACLGGQGSASGKAARKTTSQKAKTGTDVQASQYVMLKPEEAKEIMDSDKSLIMVDVRTPEEYADSRIGDAINIAVEDIGEELPEGLPDLDAKIMVYCRSGVRSKNAAEKLLGLGYKNIIDIGGIRDWPYETASGDEK